MTHQAVEIMQSLRGRRVAGGVLIVIALPLILIWLRFGPPMQFRLADMLFVIGGPGLLLLGLWAAFPQRGPAVQLRIEHERLVIRPGPRETVVSLDALTRITKDRPLTGKHDRLLFDTADGGVWMNVFQMTHEAADIIALVSMRLEERGRYLVEGRSDVLGAPTGVWDVVTGNPFAKEG